MQLIEAMATTTTLVTKVMDSIPLEFANIQKRKLKMIEVTPEVIQAIHDGEKLFLKGNDQQEVVLCTNNKTYSMKRVETSNSVLLVPPASDAVFQIAGRCIDYYEIKPIRGKVENLSQLILDVSAYAPKTKIMETVLRLSQASEVEIRKEMKKIGAIESDDGLEIIPRNEIILMMKCLLNYIIVNQLPLDGIQDSMFHTESNLNLKWCTFLLSSIGYQDANKIWILDPSKVARSSAHCIFHGASKAMDKIQFVDQWLLETPYASRFEDKILQGVALEICGSKSVELHYLPTDALPLDLNKRLDSIFHIKNGCRLDELEPYLQDYYGNNGQPKTAAEILISCCRIVDGLYYRK